MSNLDAQSAKSADVRGGDLARLRFDERPSLRGVEAHRGRPSRYVTESVKIVHRALVEEYGSNGGWPVRVRDVTERAGFRSVSVVHDYLNRLATAGLAERGPGARDGWRPVERP